MSKQNKTDWRSIQNEREKYAAYLCSREWSLLKEAVHGRANGHCERCHAFPIDAVHHATYQRKYKEELEDLVGLCSHCHNYTHAKSSDDPLAADFRKCLTYLRGVRDRLPCPPGLSISDSAMPETFRFRCAAIRQIWLWSQGLSDFSIDYCPIELWTIMDDMQSDMPFDFAGYLNWRVDQVPVDVYEKCLIWTKLVSYQLD